MRIHIGDQELLFNKEWNEKVKFVDFFLLKNKNKNILRYAVKGEKRER